MAVGGTASSEDDRQKALRRIALQKLNLDGHDSDPQLTRILELAARSTGCDGARFSAWSDEQLVAVAQTQAAEGCEFENSAACLAAMKQAEACFRPDLSASPEPGLEQTTIGGQPLQAFCLRPVLSPDQRPIGGLSLMSSRAHSTDDLDQFVDVIEMSAKLIEDALLLRSLSVRDPLTGLFNRRYFEQQTSSEWRRAMRMQIPLSFVLIDIDHFKSLNDKAGHDAGDEALIEVARLLQQSLRRAGDAVCRYGGEEFALLLPMTPGDAAKMVADKLRQKLEERKIPHPGTGAWLTISAGVSTASNSEQLKHGSVQSFLADADAALYASKKAGRNRVSHVDDLS